MKKLYLAYETYDAAESGVYRYILVDNVMPKAFGLFGGSVPQSQVGQIFQGRISKQLKGDQSFVDYGAVQPALVRHQVPLHVGALIFFECTADAPLMGEDAVHKGLKGKYIKGSQRTACAMERYALPMPLRHERDALQVITPSMHPVFLLKQAGLNLENGQVKLSVIPQQRDVFDFEALWDTVTAPKVTLLQGGAIYIEKTQACFSVDVNMSDFESSSHAVLQTNMAAIDMLEQHMRWRNMYGKILIDLVQIAEDQRNHLIARVRTLRHNLKLPLAILHRTGLLEIHRQRCGYYLPELMEYIKSDKTKHT